MKTFIEQLTCYYPENGKEPTYTIQYASGRTRQHLKVDELPQTVVDFIMNTAETCSSSDNVVIWK